MCVSLCVPRAHRVLDGNRTFDGIRDAIELGEDAIARGVDDMSAMFDYHRKYHCLVSFEVANGCFLVSTHKGAIAGYVRGKDGRQSTARPGVTIFCRHSRNPRPPIEHTV